MRKPQPITDRRLTEGPATGKPVAGKPHARRCARLSTAGLLFTVLLVLAPLLGCHSFPWTSGPVPRSVTKCRELSHQGLAAMQQGDWHQAETLLAQAVDSCPVDPDARRYYADVLANRGALDEAIRQLEAARDLSASDTSLIIRTGEMHLQMGQINQAQTRAAMALRATPRSVEAWALRGRVMHARGDLPRALSDMQRALSFRPDDRQVLSDMAAIYEQLDKPEQALLSLQTLADTYPTGEEPPELLQRQSVTLGRLNRHDDAAMRMAEATRRATQRQ